MILSNTLSAFLFLALSRYGSVHSDRENNSLRQFDLNQRTEAEPAFSTTLENLLEYRVLHTPFHLATKTMDWELRLEFFDKKNFDSSTYTSALTSKSFLYAVPKKFLTILIQHVFLRVLYTPLQSYLITTITSSSATPLGPMNT